MARCTNVIRLGHLALHSEVVSGIEKDIVNRIRFYKIKNMRKQGKEVRHKMVVVRMNDNEFEQVEKLRKKSTERNLSSYVREVVLQKPVLINYRNQSADEFLKDMLGLKKELNAIGNNFNQAVHKLHILDKIPEFRVWVNHYDALHQSLVSKVEEIKLRMNQLYEEWLQK
jgi:hypothetical protein